MPEEAGYPIQTSFGDEGYKNHNDVTVEPLHADTCDPLRLLLEV